MLPSLLLESPMFGQSGELVAIPTKLCYISIIHIYHKSKPARSIVCHAVNLTDSFNLEFVPIAKKVFNDKRKSFPIAFNVTKNHMYVNDFFLHSDFVESPQVLIGDLQNLI